MQRQGRYAPPPGASSILGLEASGHIAELGPACQGHWKIGDPAMVLLPGGGQAQYVTVPEELLMPIPAGLTLSQAAAIPEAWLTAFQLLHLLGEEAPPNSLYTVWFSYFMTPPPQNPAVLWGTFGLAAKPYPTPAPHSNVLLVVSGPHTMLAMA